MTAVTHTIRLARDQVVELSEGEAIELRDALLRLYPLGPVYAPVSPHAPAPIWPPIVIPTYVGDPIPNPFEVTCGSGVATGGHFPPTNVLERWESDEVWRGGV